MTPASGRPIRPAYTSVPPKHAPGLRIGVFGGSFNPPHAGHRLASLVALRRLKLDRVWWLVSPGNPLKDTRRLPSIEHRLDACARVANHPAIDVTGVEATLGLRFTVDVIRTLCRRCPGVHFVWVMGADNLRGFHRWQHWRAIADSVPIAVIDRPGSTLGPMRSPAGTYLSRWQIAEAAAATVPGTPPPAFTFVHGPRSPLSSTALRAAEPSPPSERGNQGPESTSS